eukprot:g18640.t1
MYSLYTYKCVAKFQTNALCKFADDTTIVGRISNGDESKYRREIEGMVTWCNENNPSLNISKTKELIIDFGKKGGEHAPININGTEVEFEEHRIPRQLKKFAMSLTLYGNCSAQDRKNLQKVVCRVQFVFSNKLVGLEP